MIIIHQFRKIFFVSLLFLAFFEVSLESTSAQPYKDLFDMSSQFLTREVKWTNAYGRITTLPMWVIVSYFIVSAILIYILISKYVPLFHNSSSRLKLIFSLAISLALAYGTNVVFLWHALILILGVYGGAIVFILTLFLLYEVSRKGFARLDEMHREVSFDSESFYANLPRNVFVKPIVGSGKLVGKGIGKGISFAKLGMGNLSKFFASLVEKQEIVEREVKEDMGSIVKEIKKENPLLKRLIRLMDDCKRAREIVKNYEKTLDDSTIEQVWQNLNSVVLPIKKEFSEVITMIADFVSTTKKHIYNLNKLLKTLKETEDHVNKILHDESLKQMEHSQAKIGSIVTDLDGLLNDYRKKIEHLESLLLKFPVTTKEMDEIIKYKELVEKHSIFSVTGDNLLELPMNIQQAKDRLDLLIRKLELIKKFSKEVYSKFNSFLQEIDSFNKEYDQYKKEFEAMAAMARNIGL